MGSGNVLAFVNWRWRSWEKQLRSGSEFGCTVLTCPSFVCVFHKTNASLNHFLQAPQNMSHTPVLLFLGLGIFW